MGEQLLHQLSILENKRQKINLSIGSICLIDCLSLYFLKQCLKENQIIIGLLLLLNCIIVKNINNDIKILDEETKKYEHKVNKYIKNGK